MSSFYIHKSLSFSWLQRKLLLIQKFKSSFQRRETMKPAVNSVPRSNAIVLTKSDSIVNVENLFKNYAPSISLFLALLALSFTAIFFKLGETEISSNAVVFNRLWIATIILGLSQKTSKVKLSSPNEINQKIHENNLKTYTKRELWLILLMVVSATASILFWAWSLSQTSVANSTVLRNLTPLFTSLCGWLILKQKFDRQFCWGMLIAIVGAVAIGWDDLQVSNDNFLGDATALLSAFFYAIYLLAVEDLRLHRSATTILFWRCSFGTLVMLPIAAFTGDSLFPTSWLGWILVIALAFVSQVCGQGLLAYSLSKFSSSFVAIVLLLTPITTAILAWLIFAESLGWLNAIAFILVLFGIYIAQSSSSVQKS